jgi:hypothetical protein
MENLDFFKSLIICFESLIVSAISVHDDVIIWFFKEFRVFWCGSSNFSECVGKFSKKKKKCAIQSLAKNKKRWCTWKGVSTITKY